MKITLGNYTTILPEENIKVNKTKDKTSKSCPKPHRKVLKPSYK